MQKAIKWFLSIFAAAAVLIVLAVIIAPMVIDLGKYKPQIENQITKATGRPFKLGGKLEPSVFPWVGVALSDLHLGNPSGYKAQDFVAIDAFEVRAKLLPMILGKFEIRRFVIKGPRIVLERQKNGRGNWEGLGNTSPSTGAKAKQPLGPKSESELALPIKDLVVGEFAITDGRIEIIDHQAGTRKEVKEINLTLTDVSLDKPIGLDFKAIADNMPLALNGRLGPVGPNPGQSPLAVDLTAKLLDALKITLQGKIDNPAGAPRINMTLQIAPFSLRKVLADIGQSLPFEPADEKVLNTIALAFKLDGTSEAISISDGTFTLDDSKMVFSAKAKEFAKPNLKLDAKLDQIDLDRYLPPPSEKNQEEAEKQPQSKPDAKTDYSPLRKLVLDARFKAGQFKAQNASMSNIELKATAKNGIFRLDPVNIDLYTGRLAATSTLNVQADTPQSTVKLSLDSVQAGPLLKDLLKKEFIEGVLNAAINLQFVGDQPDLIRKSLGGKGQLKFNDGAIVGIDLASMVRNVQSAFGKADQTTEKPHTDFAELLLPFSITKGLTKIDGSKLSSPLLRVLAGGTADLAQETLDMRVQPKFVGTIVGQGDTQTNRSGIQVPVLITGKLTKPKFRPDLKAMLSNQLQENESLQKIIPPKEEIVEDLEEKAQELLKGLPFGGGNN